MAKNSYRKWLKDEFNTQIDSLKLEGPLKTYLKDRWLDQVIWMEGKADQARSRHYVLKVIVILAGVILPVLVTTNFSGPVAGVVKTIAILLGLVVAGSTAIDDFFNYGERWRHYRSVVEMLKSEWWLFYSQKGRFAGKTHAQNFDIFSDRVEEAIRLDIKTYINEVVKKDKPK